MAFKDVNEFYESGNDTISEFAARGDADKAIPKASASTTKPARKKTARNPKGAGRKSLTSEKIKKPFTVYFDQELIEAIEEFRIENYETSMAGAIRRLVIKGLNLVD